MVEFSPTLWYVQTEMLSELRIRDFAIIDSLVVRFGQGLNVLTGETGAGKSIIVDALGLALGERAQSDMVRAGRSETIVEALFDISSHPLLDRLGISGGDGIILRRNLSSAGKSKAYINDTLVNVQTLLEFGSSLVDIHGQHEHQSLLSTENQRELLDVYGRLTGEREGYERLFQNVQSMKNELSLLRSRSREKEQRMDLLRFQVGEIDALSLKPGEREELEGERRILLNLARLRELTDSAYTLLYGGEGSLSEKLSSVIAMLKEVSRIDEALAETTSLLESAKPLLQDASSTLRSYRDRYDLDPKRLDAVEERLDQIKRLERKYGEGVEGILRYREEAGKELEGLTFSDDRIKGLEEALAANEERLREGAARLSAMRRKASKKIETAVSDVLKDLAMEKSEFLIDMKTGPLSSSGTDLIEFLFSANAGEPPRPLGRTASGGELSRVMLALKETLAEADRIPVLIFDEVDAGIGGRTAEQVGTRLRNLARKHQVLCITHLPQIAAMADLHLVVEKTEKKGGVYVTVNEAASREREAEIARMLSGTISDISLEHARELLRRRK